MSDFKTIARILGAIRSCEGRPFDVATVSPEAAPRIRGDDPTLDLDAASAFACSPHTRG